MKSIFDEPQTARTPRDTRMGLERRIGTLTSILAQWGDKNHARRDAMYAELDDYKARLEAMGAKKSGSTKFSTRMARANIRARGWRVLNSESYNVRDGRTHDVAMAMDFICFVRGVGNVGIQSYCAGTRQAHLDRYNAAGGNAAARANVGLAQVWFWEFDRTRGLISEEDLMEGWTPLDKLMDVLADEKR